MAGGVVVVWECELREPDKLAARLLRDIAGKAKKVVRH